MLPFKVVFIWGETPQAPPLGLRTTFCSFENHPGKLHFIFFFGRRPPCLGYTLPELTSQSFDFFSPGGDPPGPPFHGYAHRVMQTHSFLPLDCLGVAWHATWDIGLDIGYGSVVERLIEVGFGSWPGRDWPMVCGESRESIFFELAI
jgi:hypothetical protein